MGKNEAYGTLSDTQETHDPAHAKSAWSVGPPIILVHAALLYVQAAFGGGAVLSKLGVHAGNPVVFELIRELLSAPMLSLVALYCQGPLLPARSDRPRVLAAGFCLFANQIFYFVGLKLADPITGSAWQSSIPVFTVGMAIAAGFEDINLKKGIALSCATTAALFMTLYDPSWSSEDQMATKHLFGHACFCCCAVGCAGYLVLSKDLLAKYQAISVSGWCFSVSSAFLSLSTVVSIASTPMALFLCADPDHTIMHDCAMAPWRLPSSAVVPLVYEVVNNTLLAWWLLAWANQYVKASIVSVYTVVQPVVTAAISAWVILAKGLDWGNQYGFRLPDVQDGVAIFVIFLSLMVMFSEGTMENEVGCKKESCEKSVLCSKSSA